MYCVVRMVMECRYRMEAWDSDPCRYNDIHTLTKRHFSTSAPKAPRATAQCVSILLGKPGGGYQVLPHQAAKKNALPPSVIILHRVIIIISHM